MQFIDLKAQFAHIEDKVRARMDAVLAHGGFVMGPEVKELEAALSDFCGAKHSIACANGTDAITLALMALGVGPGDAVFVPSFTFTATAEAVLLLGAAPVFCDVDKQTFNMDIASFEEQLAWVKAEGKLKPRVIMPVDLFGWPADYDAFNAIAAREGMTVIADSAQGFGGAIGDRRAGALATLTTTSFFPAKPLGCYGDGGAIFTDDDALADLLRSIRVHGKGEDKYDIVRIGMNSRLDTLQAAILLEKLAVFGDELVARDRAARAYDDRLSRINSVTVPFRPAGMTCAWAQYTLQVDDRDALQAHLKAQGIPSAIYYPMPMHLQTAYKASGRGEGSLPNAEYLAGKVLSLPMHPYLSDADIDKVCAGVESFYAGQEAAQ